MDYGLLFRTVIHLRPTQVLYQVSHRLRKPAYIPLEAPGIRIPELRTTPIAKFHSAKGDSCSFLNQEHRFSGWDFTGNGMLWAYNQNYFDWINQEDISREACCKWIDRFIEGLPENSIGLDPYPIALRSINWVKFFCRHPECAVKPRLDSLYSQLRLLGKELEYHLMGNHLLEDAYALYIGSALFNDEKMLKKAGKLLMGQLEEQILPDGAHYEQSPMYHCILLDRLLDCINIRPAKELESYARRMLGHIGSVVWADGTIPLLNDSAVGIAPAPRQILDYASRLGLEWEPVPLKESGYRKMRNSYLEAIIDVGNITASYQPGHSHADTFNYELRIDGRPFIVDTGISTYDKTPRRQYERSTAAHNTVAVDGKDSSQVWGGFRVGKRCKATITRDSTSEIIARHDGFRKRCERRFTMTNDAFMIEDHYDGDATSHVHLAPEADISRIRVEGAGKIEIEDNHYSVEYNRLIPCKVMKIHFRDSLRYRIQ